MEKLLRDYVFPSGFSPEALLPRNVESAFPKVLYPVLHESYLMAVSQRFSNASHDGPSDIALETGLTLLALYVLIYPQNYPQIGECVSFSS
jgi:hypothetical protein